MLHLVLLFQSQILLQGEFQMRLFALKSVDESLFRLLHEKHLTHLLVLVLYQQIFLFDSLLSFE